MKKILLFFMASCGMASLSEAQVQSQQYPEPDFTHEVSFLKRDSVFSTVRLEKGSSKMESKTKMGGLGGSETGYSLEGSRSPIRLPSGNISFVYSTGESVKTPSASTDSIMRANGMDPSAMSGMGSMGGMSDPSNQISLYKMDSEKGNRKITLMKSPGAMPFGSKKTKSADKLTLSMRKIREGYWEFVVDKPLTRGEYAFVMIDMMNMSGGMLLFGFGID
ncbi:MAG TPA: hypothetical protein VK644_06040 [Chitinophagaceae bacterium]|nr:hypothetical protein [Chitinophagaceae bacterium]